ncbi:MAG: hypothetical protein ACFCVB_11345 [Nodosilinea sp.]
MVVDIYRTKRSKRQWQGRWSSPHLWRALPPLIWRGSVGLTAGLALLWAPLAQAQATPTIQPDRIIRSHPVIIRRGPTVIQRSPVNPTIIIVPPYPVPRREETQIRVELDARGREWGTVYLNGRVVHRPGNFDRQKTLYLPPGGYRLEVTGVVRSDLWASGYLDLGRDSSRLVVVRFSQAEGVSVSGSPYVWIPD